MPDRRPYVLTSPAQVRAIATPARQRLITAMADLGEFAVADLAERTGRPADSLYYHLRDLQRHRLVQQVRKEPTGRRHRAIYRLAGSRLVVDPNNRDPAYLAAMKKSAAAVLRATERLSLAALDAEDLDLVGPRSNMRLQQITARLTLREVERLRAMFVEIDEFLLGRPARTGGRAYTVTYGFARADSERR